MPEAKFIHLSEVVDASSPAHAGRQAVVSEFATDESGNPTGGVSRGEGFSILWQNGILQPNGAIFEDIIAACIDRLTFFQSSKFSCRENALAITKLQETIHWLNHRTIDRRRRGVEGTYEV